MTLGLFFLVAPSKARYEREAGSAPPTSTRKKSPALLVTTPITFSP